MWLFVGLGNPGDKYAHNRHNIGFMAVDEIVRRHKFADFKKSKFKGLLAEGEFSGEKIYALKPDTYMNLSGESVQAVCAFYKIPLKNVVVFHDELDLAAGKMRMKMAGGAAGHNGLKSIDQHLGPNYYRARLGIGHPGDRDRVHGYVLGDFNRDDKTWLEPMLTAIGEHAPLLADGKMELFATKVAAAMPKPEKPQKEDIQNKKETTA